MLNFLSVRRQISELPPLNAFFNWDGVIPSSRATAIAGKSCSVHSPVFHATITIMATWRSYLARSFCAASVLIDRASSCLDAERRLSSRLHSFERSKALFEVFGFQRLAAQIENTRSERCLFWRHIALHHRGGQRIHRRSDVRRRPNRRGVEAHGPPATDRQEPVKNEARCADVAGSRRSSHRSNDVGQIIGHNFFRKDRPLVTRAPRPTRIAWSERLSTSRISTVLYVGSLLKHGVHCTGLLVTSRFAIRLVIGSHC